MRVKVKCTGTRPIIIHNARLASPMDEFTKSISVISGKRKKTEGDRLAIARLEFEGGLYFDPEIGPYLPAQNLYKSLIEGARIIKAGKMIERGVIPADINLPLQYNGPRTIDKLWGEGIFKSPFVDFRLVRIQNSRIDKCRPIFRNWKIEAEYLIDTQIIDYDTFVRVVELAGQMTGVGTYRLLYGRFESEVTILED